MVSIKFEMERGYEYVVGEEGHYDVTFTGCVVGYLYDDNTGRLLDSLSNEVSATGLGSTEYEAKEWARNEWRDRVSEAKSNIRGCLMRTYQDRYGY